MRKNGLAMLSCALVPIIAINLYAGCRMLKRNINENNEVEPKSITTGMVDYSDYREVSDDQEVSIDESLGEKDIFSNLEEIYASSNKEYSDILVSEEKTSELYASALYAKLKSAGISDEVIREEIDNILTFSLTFTDMDEESWLRLFGNMNSTIGEFDNVIEYYYPLAIYVHKNECELTHTAHEYDENRMTCANLEEMAKGAIVSIPASDYITEMIKASEDEKIINQYNKIIACGIDFDAALTELNSIYVLSQTPMCLDEETWNELFKNLLTTVSEYDNVFEVYGDLAYYVHALNCDYEHHVDEYGVNVCEGLKLELEYK